MIRYQHRAATQSATSVECCLTSPAPSAICIRSTLFIATSNQKTFWSVAQLSRVTKGSLNSCSDCLHFVKWTDSHGWSLIFIECLRRNCSKMNYVIKIHFRILTKKECWKCVSQNLNKFKWLNCYCFVVVSFSSRLFSFPECLESVEILGKSRYFIRFA